VEPPAVPEATSCWTPAVRPPQHHLCSGSRRPDRLALHHVTALHCMPAPRPPPSHVPRSAPLPATRLPLTTPYIIARGEDSQRHGG